MTKIATSVAIASSANPAYHGDPVTIRASVAGVGAGDPGEGRLVLRDLTTNTFLGSATVGDTSKTIQFTSSALSLGTHEIRAQYEGAGDYASSSADLSLVIASPTGDRTRPAGRIAIDGGETYTNSAEVMLSLSATDPAPGSGVRYMRFSDIGPVDGWSGWEPYAATRKWTLPGVDGSKIVYAQYRDAADNVSLAVSAGIVLDRAVASGGTPASAFAVGLTIGSTTAPMRVSYPAADNGSGVASYSVAQSRDGGTTYSAIPLTTPTTSSVVRSVTPGTTSYRFRTRVTDNAGNSTSWRYGPAFTVGRYEQPPPGTAYTGTWVTSTVTSASGGSERYASTAGATVRYTFTGRAFGLVSSQGPNYGKAAIYVNGVRVGIVDLYASSRRARAVTFNYSFSTSATRSVEIRVLGTKRTGATGTRVAVDAFLVAK